jgi:hypothetical protein
VKEKERGGRENIGEKICFAVYVSFPESPSLEVVSYPDPPFLFLLLQLYASVRVHKNVSVIYTNILPLTWGTHNSQISCCIESYDITKPTEVAKTLFEGWDKWAPLENGILSPDVAT